MVAVGCAGRARLEPMEPTDFQTRVLTPLRVRTALLHSLRAQMTLRIDEGDQTTEARTILYFQRPDSLRLDVLDPMGAPVVVLRAYEGQLSYLDVRANKGSLGPLSDAVLREWFRVNVRISDVQKALLANPFLDGSLDGARIAQDNRRVRVDRRLADGTREEVQLRWKAEEPVVDFWVVRDAQDRIVQRIRFARYQDLGGILFPREVTIERPPERVRLRMQVHDPQPNVALSAAVFAHRFPPNAVVKRWKTSSSQGTP